MQKTLRPTRLKGWYEYYRELCPICNRKGGCIVHEKGDRVACIRVTSNTPFSTSGAIPSWLHWLKDKKKIDTSGIKQIKSANKLPNEQLDKVYRALIEQTNLNDAHLEHLTSAKRGLTTEQIIRREYRSMPEKSWNVCRDIQMYHDISDFTGVPGFYKYTNGNRSFWVIKGRDSILIPFRNEYNQIVGFQMRKDKVLNEAVLQTKKHGLQARVKEQPNLVQVLYDGEIIFEEKMEVGEMRDIAVGRTFLGFVKLEKQNRYFWLSSVNEPNGTSPGNPLPVHVSVPSHELAQWETGTLLKKKAVWLSEGGLKCDIATDILQDCYSPKELEEIGDTMIAIPGVGSWRLALPVLENMGVERVNLCFDADVMKNPAVKLHLLECAKELHSRNISLYLALWNEQDGNGIDDLLLNRSIPVMKALKED